MAKIGGITILCLVALRLACGYHFFSQGLEKLDPNWTSAGFLRGAKGPLAPMYKKYVAAPHRAEELLATKPAEGKSATADLEAEIVEDWRRLTEQFTSLAGQTEESIKSAKAALENRIKQLGVYFNGDATTVGQSSAIADYQHELTRLAEDEQVAPAGTLPFNDKRVTENRAKLYSTAQKWIGDIVGFDNALASDLRSAAPEGVSSEAVSNLLSPPTPLSIVDQRVTWVVLGAGVCLLLGFATRLGALAAAGFLLSVMATQPPWVYGANTEYFFYQLVEFFALLTLAAVGAGRWLGFDGVIYRLFFGLPSKDF
jgi:uncharacterized membrane protein YphA (DoxX/SURF4 family)